MTLDIPTVAEQREQTEKITQRLKGLRSKSAKTVSSEGRQDYETPPELVDAVERDYGAICFDLAAASNNSKCGDWHYSEKQNSLTQDWFGLVEKIQLQNGFLWLNPPFKNVRPWMEKCREESKKGARILTLTKASIASKWYRQIVAPNAYSGILTERVKFVGMKDVFTQDLMLSEWGTGKTGLGYWDWKRK